MVESKTVVHILDVGHGNSALVIQGKRAVVIDAPGGDILLRALRQCGLTSLDMVVVSHADADHIGGLATLLTSDEIFVRRILVNPDPTKNSVVWNDFCVAVGDARRRGRDVKVENISANHAAWVAGRSRIEILAPSPESYMTGVGGRRPRDGRRVTSNSSSGVVRVWHGTTAVVVLAGDMDEATLADIRAQGLSLEADTLVFPHHGGQSRSRRGRTFAQELAAAVQPNLVVFSHGRERHSNPRPEMIEGVRDVVPSARVVCTQLSRHCAVERPRRDPAHLTVMPAAGMRDRSCCGGSLTLTVASGHVVPIPSPDEHRAFIEQNAPSALCRLIVVH